jgi:hypothetical protein
MISRREFTTTYALVPFVGLSCILLDGCADTFANIQGYVATIKTFVDTLVPIIVGLDPAIKTEAENIQKQVDDACDAFAKLKPTDPGGGDIAKLIISWTNEALTLAELIPAVPPQVKAILAAVQLLLIAIAAFFKIALSPAAAPIAVGSHRTPSERLVYEAQSRYQHASNKDRVAKEAAAEIRDWIAQRHGS